MSDWYAIGQIVKGAYLNKYIAQWSDTEWAIVPAAHFERSSIWGGDWKYKNPGSFGTMKYSGPKPNEIISENTVDHFVEIGSQATGPNGVSMIKGALIGGLTLGLAAGAASATTHSYIAFYMKDGTNFVAYFTNGAGWQKLKAAIFNLASTEKSGNESLRNQQRQVNETVVPSADRFEAIKKYKELLDLGIISQEEFDEKKKEFLESSNATSFISASPVDEESTSYSVELTSFEIGNKIPIIKEIRVILGLGLAEAKSLVESAPVVIMQGLSKPNANELCSRLEAVGATVRVKPQ